MIKYTSEEIQLINHVETTTKTIIKDCIIEPNNVTFIVKKGGIGQIIGKNGSIINKIKKDLGKEINVYEHSEKPEDFIKNLLYPVKVQSIEIKDSTAIVKVEDKDKKRAIGKEGKKIKKVKDLISRHFPITEVKII